MVPGKGKEQQGRQGKVQEQILGGPKRPETPGLRGAVEGKAMLK